MSLRSSALFVLVSLVLTASSLAQSVTGQWEFDLGDLSATIGTSAQYWLKAPPTRDVETETQFGTTTSFGIPDIAGHRATVMKFPQTESTMGYSMFPEIEPNGGGTKVNQYTIILDILYPASSGTGYRSLFQTDDCSTTDGDLFIGDAGHGNGIGISTVYDGTINTDTWYRVAFSFDLTGPTLTKFIDGVQVGTQTLGEGVDARWSLFPKADNRPTLLFADEDGESAEGYVNSIQIRNYAMPASEIAALGAASSSGIPMTPSAAGVVAGQWDFESGNLAPTVGRGLAYFKGCGGCGQDLGVTTKFGLASSFGVPPINQVDPRVMQFPAVLPCTGYLFTHGAAPNGGGGFVNQYTIIMDVLYPQLPSGDYAALFQTNTGNANDSDWFLRGTASEPELGISLYGGVVPNGTWNRLAFVADLVQGTVTSYVNGVQAVQNGGQALDGRFALDPTLLFFTDNDSETALGYVNSIQIRDYAMSAAELQALGGPTAAGIGKVDARLAPDTNSDGYVDGTDLSEFVACALGPAIALPAEKQLLCRNFDVDDDSDVDQVDFAAFQQYYSGAAQCAPRCYYP